MFGIKTKIIAIFSAVILGGLSISAQIPEGSAITVAVPHAFTVKDKTFDAGVYTIQRTPITVDSSSLLVLRGENGKSMVFDTMLSRSNTDAPSTQLVFDTVGDTNFLTAIVVKGQVVKNEIPKTKAQTRALTEGSARRHFLTITDTGF